MNHEIASNIREQNSSVIVTGIDVLSLHHFHNYKIGYSETTFRQNKYNMRIFKKLISYQRVFWTWLIIYLLMHA